ncbi:uncharacterized protein LOC110838870 isoform X2 [Zootermopsis nevadensis]|uniref:uncharacterized protein LOC110838870 isoform X2 n=1 Tax=Zootermopsis nevadensis TaxID=136037 RepID=UPI000B8ED202|nr:uncharacterized protein LOC110838870 isoform X2 [Zootermopsis nevadensis]
MNVDPSPEPYLPTPDTIKDDEDDMMPMMHDDADMMELDDASRTPVTDVENVTELDIVSQTTLDLNVTSSAEMPVMDSVVHCQASMDTVEDSSSEALKSVVSEATTQISSSGKVARPDLSCGLTTAAQLPISGVHQANRTAVVTFPGLTVPATSYSRGQLQNLSPLLVEEHTFATDTVSVLNTLIASAVAPVTRQVTSLVPSAVAIPCSVPFALDSELTNSTGTLPVQVPPATSAKEKLQETPSTLTASYLTSPSAVVTEGVGITVTSEVGLTTPVASPGCSTAAVPLHADSLVSTACVTSDSAPHMHSSVTGASPTFSIIKSATASSSPRRTSILQGSAGSLSAMSAVPVCIIRSQSGGSGSGISTTVSLISSAVASTVALPVTSSQLTSATVANLVADAVNAARLPYPPASVGQHLAFTTASVVPLVTASPAGVSVIASASTVSLGGISMSVDSLVPPPRMSTAPVTSSQSVSPHVPVTVETNSSIIPIVDTKQSSGENQNYIVKHAPPTSVQANAEEKDVDIRSKYLTSQSTGSQKEDTEILADMSSKFSQVTRPSMLENTSRNLNNELPLQSVGTEPSSVCAVQNAPQKVDDDDDEILMKTMQLIFQDTRPSVLATVERVPQSAAAVVQQETAGTETDRRRWQHNIPDTSSIVGSVIVTEDKCSSDTQQSLVVSISSPPVTDKEPIKELTLADKLLHPPVQDSLSASNKIQAVSKPYPVPSSNLPTVFIEPHQREEVRMDYEDGDKTSDIPNKTNASYSHNILPASQIEPSTNLKLPLQTTESTASSEALVDVLRAPSAIPPETSAVFSSPSQSTVTASTTSSEVKSIPETALSSKVVKSTAVLPRSVFSGGLSGSGQSMLACRLSTIASGPPVNTTQTSQSAAPQGIMTSSEIVSQIATVPVPMSTGCPVVMTPRISSTAGRFSPIVNTGQAVASVVRQYVAYTQQQVASQTSPVIAGISRSLSMPSPAHSPHLPAQGSVSVLAPTTAARVISSKSHQSLAAEQFVQSRTEAPPVLTVSSSVMQSQATVSSMPQPSGTILQTRVSAPPSASGLAAIQHVTSYEGTNRTDGDIETVVTSALERLGRDVILSVSSESATSSRNSDLVDSSKYPYASSAPPRIQSSCSVFSSVMYPQRRMSAGEIKVEEPARSCQFEQLTAVKTETLDLCLFQESPVPTTSIIMQQQQHSSPTLTSISKPVATSCIMASQPSVATIVPKTETQHLVSSCKFSSTTQALSQPQQQAPVPAFPHRMEESQNVLLKQLLQNTGCAQTQSQQTSSVPTHHHGAPSLPVVPSLEAQLARPVPPTPSSLLPPLLTNDSPQSQTPQLSRQLSHLTTRETSLVSRPPPQLSTSLSIPVQTDRRPDPPNRENVLSPPATLRSCANVAESNLHEPTPLSSPHVVTIKKEVAPPLQSPSADVKKETVSDDSSEQVASEKKEFHGKTEQPSKDEIGDLGMEASCDKTTQDQAALDAKKVKRRLYQQKRRQSQGKEPTASGGTPKKQRIRKGSKVDEDYDTYIENLMMQLRQLPPMSVLEPALSRNYAVCSIFGSGDLTKIGTTRDYSTRHGDLKGSFCAAYLAHVSDHYNTQPFGDLPPLPPQPPVSTQRGFYDQEFAALKLENDDDKRPDGQTSGNRDRGNDTPDTVVSSSSPECVIHELPIRFPGLKLIEEEDSEKEEETRWMKRSSPIIPIISPIPIRLRPGMQMAKEISDVDKENVGVTRDHIQLKTRFGVYPPAPLRDAGNVTVTLTLTSAAAGDILGVLRHLANILSIPAPSGYQIVERTSTPPSQKLGLYRTKGKDGKEGAPVDIQSILNGAAKFCRHCDVVILSSLIRKKASELPFLAKDDVVENGDDLYFCSSACYMQFALMHRSPSISEDKAAAIVDHLCQTAESPSQQKKVCPPESTEKVKEDERSEKKVKEEDEQMDVDRQLNEFEDVKTEQDDAEKSESAEPQSIPTQSKKTESVSVNTEVPLEKLEKKPASGTVPTASAVATVTVPSSTLHQGTSSDKRSRRHTGDDQAIAPSSHCPPPTKLWKGVKYKYWTPGAIQPAVKYKKPTDKEVTEMLFRMGITMTPAKIPEDTRKCMFCHQIGDGVGDGTARLLNFDVDKWVHLNCALWSDDVYETVNGALMNLENSLQQSLVLSCVVCHRMGATIRCFKLRCSNVYHLGCAVKDGCVFFKNKSTYCSAHIPKNEKDNELTTLSVFRRVYVNRDENRQVATVMHQDHNNLLRVGSLIFLSVGQLLPHQLQAFHTPNYIYPIGYKIVRFYWSMRVPNKRCRYVCSIHDVAGRPEFRVLVQEPCQDDLELRDCTPRAVWARILEPLASLRKEMGGVQVFPRFISGEDLFGLTEPAVVRVLESLPGVETLTDYRFKYGRNPLLELPLAVNPTGCARTEPKLRNQFLWKRPHTQRTGSSSRPIFVPTASMAGEAACPYSKQFVHSKSSQYKKMKQEWRNNVYLARSKIQGLGLYAARDLERHTMVIEYIGEVIRTELSELREKQYEARNRGIYMFRLDEDRVVDATLSGGLARYINHSCNPNCVAEIVEVERDLRIIIFAKRRISRGEELAYDYKFDIEDDQHKIPCNCGAPNCRKWMN